MLTIKITGELDHHSAESLRKQIDQKILSSSDKEIIFDLSGTTFMDSSGIGVLLGRYKLFAVRKMYISGATGSVDRVLKLSGVYSLMPKKEMNKNEK